MHPSFWPFICKSIRNPFQSTAAIAAAESTSNSSRHLHFPKRWTRCVPTFLTSPAEKVKSTSGYLHKLLSPFGLLAGNWENILWQRLYAMCWPVITWSERRYYFHWGVWAWRERRRVYSIWDWCGRHFGLIIVVCASNRCRFYIPVISRCHLWKTSLERHPVNQMMFPRSPLLLRRCLLPWRYCYGKGVSLQLLGKTKVRIRRIRMLNILSLQRIIVQPSLFYTKRYLWVDFKPFLCLFTPYFSPSE